MYKRLDELGPSEYERRLKEDTRRMKEKRWGGVRRSKLGGGSWVVRGWKGVTDRKVVGKKEDFQGMRGEKCRKLLERGCW